MMLNNLFVINKSLVNLNELLTLKTISSVNSYTNTHKYIHTNECIIVCVKTELKSFYIQTTNSWKFRHCMIVTIGP